MRSSAGWVESSRLSKVEEGLHFLVWRGFWIFLVINMKNRKKMKMMNVVYSNSVIVLLGLYMSVFVVNAILASYVTWSSKKIKKTNKPKKKTPL